MRFLIKIAILATISGIMLTMGVDNKNNGILSELAMIPQIIKSGFNAIQNKETATVKRICRIKPNGDEECKNLTAE